MAVYAMMASNCYHSPKKRAFDVKKAQWHQVDLTGSATTKPTKAFDSGFAFDVFHHNDGIAAVIAFRGTDGIKDWFWANLALPLSVPYKQATKAVRDYKERFPERQITIVGHSLGGGMALGTSARLGLPAFAFNPSPRVFDGLGDAHVAARRVVVCQSGDPLAKIGKYWHKIATLVAPADAFECPYNVPPKKAHRIDLLAFNVGAQGAMEPSPAGALAASMIEGWVPAEGW